MGTPKQGKSCGPSREEGEFSPAWFLLTLQTQSNSWEGNSETGAREPNMSFFVICLSPSLINV